MTRNRRWSPSLLVPALLLTAGALSSCVDTTQAEKMGLPTPAAVGVLEAFPKAIIIEPVTKSDAGRAKLYTAKFYADGLVRHVTVTAGGVVTSVQEPVSLSQVPAPALAAIGKAAGVALVVKHDLYAEVRDGQLVARDKPQTVYDARLVHQGAKATIEVAADGTLLDGPEWDRPTAKAPQPMCPRCTKAPCVCKGPQAAKACPHCQKTPCACKGPQAAKVCPHCQKTPCQCKKAMGPMGMPGPMPMHPGAGMHPGAMHPGAMHPGAMRPGPKPAAPAGDDDDEHEDDDE